MPYARTNWKTHELKLALANPVHSASGPHAHSSKHATAGELANHPLFQRARVTALVVDDQQREGNASWWAKNPDGSYVNNSATRTQHKLPRVEVGTHSALDVDLVAKALKQALNDHAMQPHLATLDGGTDMKVHVNYTAPIGTGNIHRASGSTTAAFVSLFVYCKPHPNNRDVPIFQTVVPSDQHKVAGAHDIVVTV